MSQKEELDEIMLKLQNYAKVPNGVITAKEIQKAFRNYGLPQNIADQQISQNSQSDIRNIIYSKKDEKKCRTDMLDFGTRGDWYFFDTNYDNRNQKYDFKWKVYIPIKPGYHSFLAKNIIAFLCDSGIISSSKVSNVFRSDSLIINLTNKEDITKLNEYVNKNPALKDGLGKHNPFIPDSNGIGVIHGSDTETETSYTERLSGYLAHYVETCKKLNRIDLITSTGFLESMKNALDKGMVKKPDEIKQIVENMDIILNDKWYNIDDSKQVNSTPKIENNTLRQELQDLRENSRENEQNNIANTSIENNENEILEVQNDNIVKPQKISQPIAQFLEKNGFDLNNLPNEFNFNVNGKKNAKQNDFEYTLLCGNSCYKNKHYRTVNIKDIIGTLGIDENTDLLTCISKYYNDNDAYGERDLDKLKEDIMINVDNILESDIPLKLIQMDGGYYVGRDGNHRTMYLMLAYSTLKEKYKDDPEKLEQIENKFNIKAEVTAKSGYDKIDKISYCLSKCWNDDVKLSFHNESDSIATLQIGDNIYELKDENEFINYFNDYLSSLDKDSKEYIDLENELSNIGFPNKVIKDEEKQNFEKEENDSERINIIKSIKEKTKQMQQYEQMERQIESQNRDNKDDIRE